MLRTPVVRGAEDNWLSVRRRRREYSERGKHSTQLARVGYRSRPISQRTWDIWARARNVNGEHGLRLLRCVGIVFVLPGAIDPGVEASVKRFSIGWQTGYAGLGGSDWG